MRWYLPAPVLLAAALGCGQPASGPALPTVPPDHVVVAPKGETMENPQYTSWARFPVGTKAVQKSVTTTEPNKTVTTTSYSLVEKKDDVLVVEMQVHTVWWDGHVEDNPPEKLRVVKTIGVPPGYKPGQKPKGVTEEGEETLTMAGREFKTKWYKGRDNVEGGAVESQNWSSDEAPGGLVKSVVRIPKQKQTTVIELVEVKVP
jgi:hypothetical protein